MRLEFVKNRIKQNNAFDPNQPYRSGGEMGMFLPFAWRGVDMEGIAELMTPRGSFYPSIHLAWHYDEVYHEVVRPHYTQAALTNDYFKGGWAASWESTGGPQQFSGGKGGNGFTVDDGIMTQLMYNYMAAGYRGFGLWCWSARTAGWEAGEFALLDRHNQLTERAKKVGLIGQACQKYRDELWHAHKEPLVGIYTDWDNEAIWAAMSVRGRDVFKQWPIDARMGASRALINANVPFEYVTATDLRKGLANRYKVIYMPFIIAVAEDMMQVLSDYVADGGRLVFDGPSFWYDDYGKLFKTDKGTVFEQTFGATVNDYQYAGINVPWSIEQHDLKGFTLNISTSTANVLKAYNNGLPAITEHRFGKGTAVILGCEASMMCFKPGNGEMEQFLVDQLLGSYRSPYSCNDAIVYRLAADVADHYFIINDYEAKSVRLNFGDFKYTSMIDPLTGETMDMSAPIEVKRYNGRWVRMEK
jgi:beta-galactosidase